MLVVMKSACLTMLTQLVDTGMPLDGLLVKLFQNNVEPSPNDVAAEYDAADFAGYAASTAIVWGTPFLDSDGKATVVGDSKQFTSTGPTPSNTIYGYYVTTAANVLVYAERFATPVLIDADDQAIVVVPEFQLSDAGA